MDGYIETIRLDNFVQICTNNASSMKSAANLLIHCFPSFYFQGSFAHCLNFWKITKKQHGWNKLWRRRKLLFISYEPSAIFHCYESNLLLLNPSKTWFATIFYWLRGYSNLDLPLNKLLLILIGQLLLTHCMATIVKNHSPRQKIFEWT